MAIALASCVASAWAQPEPASLPPVVPVEPVRTVAPTLTLRSGEGIPSGEVIGISSTGVSIGTRIAPSVRPLPSLLIGWDRVRTITVPEGWKSLDGDDLSRISTYLASGERVWRARRRLERNDAPAAEPLFETAFAEYRLKPGPTSAVVAEGLLRCRLRRGAHVLALEPWLAWVAASERDPAGASHFQSGWADAAGLPPMLDGPTDLVPALPPIWLGWESVRGLASGDAGADAWPVDSVSGALMGLYRASARYEAGQAVEMPSSLPEHPGVAIVAAITRARIGTPEQRQMGRRQVEERLRSSSSPWLEAWLRAGLGRSLVQERDVATRRRGVLELLEVPARFGRTHAYLSGVALAEASTTMDSLGDASAASILRQDLARTYPTHPALTWPPIRDALSREGIDIDSTRESTAATQPTNPGTQTEPPR